MRVVVAEHQEAVGSGPCARPGRRMRLRYWPTRLLVLMLLLGPAWALDEPLFALSRAEHTHSTLSDYADLAQQFGEPAGVAIVLGVIWTLDRTRRRALVPLLAAVLVAGGVAAGTKLLIGRARPRETDGLTVVTGPQWPGAAKNDPGFPSGHTAAAFALAYGLCRLYPHGQPLFLGFAVACAASRVYGGLHFLTDVLVAAWLGWELAGPVWNSAWLRTRWPGAWDCPAARRL